MRKLMVPMLILPITLFAAKPLVFWHGMTVFQGKEMQKLINKYNRENRGRRGFIPVSESKLTDPTLVNTKLKLAFRSGRSSQYPDIAQIYGELLYNNAKRGRLLQLDSFYHKDRAFMKDLHRTMRSMGSMAGSPTKDLYGVPFNISTLVIYYNKKLFRRAGIRKGVTRPINYWKWDDMLDIAKKCTRGGYWGLVWYAKPYYFLPIIWAHNSYLFLVDPNQLDSGSIFKRNQQAVDTWADLFRKHKVMPENLTLKEARQMFLGGKIAMGPETCGGLAFAEKNLPYPLGVAPMPQIKKRATYLGGGLLSIIKKPGMSAARKKACWMFIKWMVSKENTIAWHKGTGYIPVRYSALRSASLRLFHRRHRNFSVAVRQLKHAYVPKVRYNVLSLDSVFTRRLGAMLSNDSLSSKKVLRDINKAVKSARY